MDAATGRRLLCEIEECTLEEVLHDFRKATQPRIDVGNHHAPLPAHLYPKTYPIPELDDLVKRHFKSTHSPTLSLSGRYYPLVYLLIATLIAKPHQKTVVIVDVEGRFDATRVLECTPYTSASATKHALSSEQSGLVGQRAQQAPPQPRHVRRQDLRHIHIYIPARGSPSHIREVIASAEYHMLYSNHASRSREWWGTIVIGGGGPSVVGPTAGSSSSSALAGQHVGADVTTGWKGWLKVEKDDVPGFALGVSVEEALRDREQRQRAVDRGGWRARCVWGSFHWK